jgi:hypothetical protein
LRGQPSRQSGSRRDLRCDPLMATERGTRSAKTPRKMRVARGGRKVVGAQNDRGRDAGISNDLELWLDVLKDRKRNLVYRAV